ncbi:hypothetical protein Q9966_015438 [Columba livia]|nr:hypothetical protein Q9966_015438 [Columba livia]
MLPRLVQPRRGKRDRSSTPRLHPHDPKGAGVGAAAGAEILQAAPAKLGEHDSSAGWTPRPQKALRDSAYVPAPLVMKV